MKLGFSYKFLFYLLLIVVLAYIALKYFNVIEGNRSGEREVDMKKNLRKRARHYHRATNPLGELE